VTGWDIGRGVYNARYIGEWIVASLPLILCGFSMGFAAKTGKIYQIYIEKSIE
jgi:simple sugar transport system permease protein